MKYIILFVSLTTASCKKDPSVCKNIFRKSTEEAERKYYERKDTTRKWETNF